jgi:phosphohistidine phosphatase
MELILWRHAEAAEASAGQPDLKRRLTSRGEKQARRVARWLGERQPKHLRILVSPAVRCQQTAHALALPFDVVNEIGTSASAAELFSIAWSTSSSPRDTAVMLVGHQPTLGRVAALILTGQEADWNVRKGALWWFSIRTRGAMTDASLRTVIGPDII